MGCSSSSISCSSPKSVAAPATGTADKETAQVATKVEAEAKSASGGDDLHLFGGPNQGLMTATMCFFAGFAGVAVFGPSVELLKEKMEIGPVESSWLLSSPVLSGALMRIPFGAYAGSAGARKVMLLQLSLGAVGILGISAMTSKLEGTQRAPSGTYAALLSLGVCVGFAISTFPVGASQTSYWFTQQSQGTALGIFAGLGTFGPALVNLALPRALQHLGLASTYLVWFAALVAVTIIYYIFGYDAWYFQLRNLGLPEEEARSLARERGQCLFPKGGALQEFKLAVSSWKCWALVVVYFGTFGGMVSLTAWLPMYWQELHGLTTAKAGLLTALYTSSSALWRVAGGCLTDRLGGELVLFISLSVMLIGAVLVTMSQHLHWDILGVLLLAGGMGVANNAVYKLVPKELPQAVGSAAGLVGGLGCFGGFVITPALATFVHYRGAAGYSAGFIIFAALALVGMLLAGLLALNGHSSARDLPDACSKSQQESLLRP